MTDSVDVIERFCKLQSKVADYLNEYHKYSSDCFCGRGGYWINKENKYDGTAEMGFRNDMKSVEFIESAVAEKIIRLALKDDE